MTNTDDMQTRDGLLFQTELWCLFGCGNHRVRTAWTDTGPDDNDHQGKHLAWAVLDHPDQEPGKACVYLNVSDHPEGRPGWVRIDEEWCAATDIPNEDVDRVMADILRTLTNSTTITAQQKQKIDWAYQSLRYNIEVAKAGGDWTLEQEGAQMIALSAIADAGFDYEADEDLMRYCLKATDVEAAEATLLHFTRWVETQQLAEDDDEEPDLDHYCERKVILAKRDKQTAKVQLCSCQYWVGEADTLPMAIIDHDGGLACVECGGEIHNA